MICIVLAAGYATRLYPLTENFPKPLLKVGEKTIMDWLLDDIDATGTVSRYIVVSNHRYAEHFRSWAAEMRLPVDVIDDGSVSNETRLGAVKDIQFAIDWAHADDDLLVIAGDNVLDFSLRHFIDFARGRRAPCVMRFWQSDREKLKKTGVAEVAEDGRIVRMEEKPAEPFANWCVPPFYYYPRADAHYVAEAIREGCGVDAPGSFVAWLSRRTDVFTMEMPGSRYDIGTMETYRDVQQHYRGIEK